MKFTVAALTVVAATACLPTTTQAFAGISPRRASSSSFVPVRSTTFLSSSAVTRRPIHNTPSSLSLQMSSYTVGIVGATGAVGKEIRQCLEKSDFPVEKLRIFGSSRSAKSTVETTKFGNVQVELFSEQAARECDVVFLAVSGDFALEHAKAISEGDDGAVVIDNSVRNDMC